MLPGDRATLVGRPYPGNEVRIFDSRQSPKERKVVHVGRFSVLIWVFVFMMILFFFSVCLYRNSTKSSIVR